MRNLWRALWCVILDHCWCWHMVRGDDGGPGGDVCLRCNLERPNYTLPCRCIGWRHNPLLNMPCKCEFEGFAPGIE